jgi:hypothetical protein
MLQELQSKDGKFNKKFDFNNPTEDLAVELSNLFAEFLPPDPFIINE